jgi:hypothetical protein
MGGMGGMMGGLGGESGGGGYSAPQADGFSDLGDDKQVAASKLGMSFPIGDLSRGLSGKRVHIRLPHVSIRAGESESVFLPAIPKTIEEVRVFAASVSNKHPLAAFQITLNEGYQLPGGPGTVWADSGYAGDIMFPRLIAEVPQMVTYALDSAIEVSSEIKKEHSTKSTYRIDGNDILIATQVSERRVRYTLANDGVVPRKVSIEHRPSEDDWRPTNVEEQKGKPTQLSFRYNVDCPAKSIVSRDVLETKTTETKWPKGTTWTQLKRLTLDPGMSAIVRETLENRIKKLAEYESFQASETEFAQANEKAAAEQHRIKSLMAALNRQDELHARFLKKLQTLEDEIDETSLKLSAIRKKIQEAKSRLVQEGMQ